MKTFLKARFKKNPLTSDPGDYYAQVVLNSKLGISEIIDLLVKENKHIDRESAFELINLFNKKTVDLIVSGNQVNTGIVSLSPTIKGSFYNKKWNPAANRVDVNISQGFELSKALLETNIQIMEEQGEITEIIDQVQKISERQQNIENNQELNTIKSGAEPPCGMAFRQWLCNS